MKVKANLPKLNQRYYNPFKEKGIYPFNKIGRVLIDKDTAEILMYLGENDSTLSKVGAPWIYDETRHDIAVYFPKFYSKRNWNQEELSDSFITEIPVNHVEQIPENIKRKGFEIFPEFVREDGSVRPYILIGATKGVSLNNQLRSIIGYKPTVNKTLQEFLNESRFGRNNNWNIETIGIVSMIQFLYKIAFQDLDSQKTIGLGYSNRTELGLTGSTIKLGNHTGSLDPFQNSPDKPHDSISMSFQCVDGELVVYNKKDSDPMPIKTTNMAGLQKWEETDDYIIYLCKDATMTVVQNYVTGTFQEFQERKALIEASQELMKSYAIQWSTQDSIDLINEINNEALAKLEATLMLLTENKGNKIQVLSERAVPVTYECCFRMDKKSGEFYIGEGYENLAFGKSYDGDSGSFKYLKYKRVTSQIGSEFYITTNLELGKSAKIRTHNPSTTANIPPNVNLKINSDWTNLENWIFSYDVTFGDGIPMENIQITKTSTPKPFVKSVMPSGKLAFVTNAGRRTHSLIIKGANNVTSNRRFYKTSFSAASERFAFSDTTVGKVLSGFCSDGNYFSLDENGIKTALHGFPNDPQGGFVILNEDENGVFSQLLIYKGNLTEAELKAELAKDIKATDNQNTSLEYPANGNQISLFGIEDFYGNCNSMINGIQSKDDSYYINNKKTNLIPITNTLNNTFKYGYIKKIADLGYLNIAKEVNYINDQPDERLSLFFGIENGELVYHDSPNDPFPLKTINGNGIQKLEETEDYTIYIDKDAVFTRIEQYVAGSYQTFIERKKDIDSSSELLKIHDITWTSEDDSKLIQDINNEALKKLESQRMMLSVEKELIQPIILEPKIVPTTYDCCFTIRKDTNEFYINEGYENLAQHNNCDNHSHNTVSNVDSNGVVTVSTMDSQTIQMNGRYGYKTPLLIPSTEYTASIKIIESLKPSDCVLSTLVNSFLNPYDIKLKLNIRADATGTSQSSPTGSINQYLATVGDNEIKMLYQITKTSTPKPFIKTIQPDCKMDFETPATSETHSFILKNCSLSKVYISSGGNLATKRYPIIQGIAGAGSFGDYFEFSYQTNSPAYENKIDFLLSKNYIKDSLNSTGQIGVNGQSKGRLNLTYQLGGYTSNSGVGYFSQLLIYKGNLTEAELKAELAKNIKLKHFEYKEENSNLYYTDLFKSHSLGQIGICILNSNYTSLNFGGIFATDFSEIETFKNNLTGARVCYYP